MARRLPKRSRNAGRDPASLALIALVSSGLHGNSLLNRYMPAIFGQALLGVAVAHRIAALRRWQLGWPGDKGRAWRTLALALGTALLVAVVGVLLGTVGISITSPTSPTLSEPAHGETFFGL